ARPCTWTPASTPSACTYPRTRRGRPSRPVPSAVQPLSVATPSVTSLSVLIPTHGRAELLPRVVNAWAAQDIGSASGYQIVVVDDGSPDATAAVLDELEGRHPQVLTVVRQPNRG